MRLKWGRDSDIQIELLILVRKINSGIFGTGIREWPWLGLGMHTVHTFGYG